MEPKIAEVRRMVADAGLDDVVDVEVDGGIGPDTVARRRARPAPTCWSPAAPCSGTPTASSRPSRELRALATQAATP